MIIEIYKCRNIQLLYEVSDGDFQYDHLFNFEILHFLN